MEEEANTFFKIWFSAIACLCYCHFISSRLPPGTFRFLSVSPVFYLFTILPLYLTTVHLCGTTAFFLTWLANFKLLLFSFNQGPLSPPSKLDLFKFISLACLPIKLPTNDTNPFHNQYPLSTKSFLLAFKVALLAIIFSSYKYKQFMHPYVILILYCLHIYIELELLLAICATPARALFGFELEPQFNEPYLTTSLQDFWGRRWNLMVTSILRPTVYNPIRDFLIRIIGHTWWASSPAVFVTFVVSGIVHELIYFYLTRVSPTWEVTWFFVLHGVFVAVEVAIKRKVKDRWRLHPVVSGPLTLVLIVVTGLWLFFPQLTRNGIDEKAIRELSSLRDFVKHKLSTLKLY